MNPDRLLDEIRAKAAELEKRSEFLTNRISFMIYHDQTQGIDMLKGQLEEINKILIWLYGLF